MRLLAPALISLMVLTACTSLSPGVRESNANRLAFPVFMIPREVDAWPFKLKAYERMHEKGTTAQLYIEGTGNPDVSRSPWDLTPTPKDPIGLALASRDSAKNVVWLGRPCQFRMTYQNSQECPQAYQTDAMFAPEVIEAYNKALDGIKARYQITAFHITGYDSGGGLAAILAAQRSDILTLRTVAGLLDTQTWAQAHNMPPIDQSLNPIDSAPKLVNKPQHHYIAQFDNVVPNTVYHSYAQAINDERCIGYTFIQNVDHNYDWTENWPGFLKEPVTCMGENPDEAERAARKRVYEPQIGPKK